jgi:hypothetical protein
VEKIMRSPLVIATLVCATLGAVPASAQSFDNAVVAQCSRTVGQIKFEGWPADRNRDMMMLACESNGGTIPGGAQQTRPASLQPNGPARNR